MSVYETYPWKWPHIWYRPAAHIGQQPIWSTRSHSSYSDIILGSSSHWTPSYIRDRYNGKIMSYLLYTWKLERKFAEFFPTQFSSLNIMITCSYQIHKQILYMLAYLLPPPLPLHSILVSFITWTLPKTTSIRSLRLPWTIILQKYIAACF